MEEPLSLPVAAESTETNFPFNWPGCDYVIHVASPFQMEGSEEQILKPALEGTSSVLKACRDFHLKKCIFTSSIGAVIGAEENKEAYDESDWADETSRLVGTYQRSKILAEKLVWDFRAKLPEDSGLQLVSLNPGFIVGTVCSLLNAKAPVCVCLFFDCF